MHTLRTTHPRVLRLTASALLLSIMLVALNVSSASAYTNTAAGSAGGFSLERRTQGLGLHEGGAWVPVPGLRVHGPTVWRSPATSGAQNVGYTYLVQRWSGTSWQNAVWSPAEVARLGSDTNSWTRLPVRDFGSFGISDGYYRVILLVRWSDANTGRWLGSQEVSLVHSGDYECLASLYVSCSVGSGWIYLNKR
jgi:hypothetical protein